ncbi:hypothetical protein ACS0TY_032403 [Phlomoides rotata]
MESGKGHQTEPPQGFQVLGSGKANYVDTSSSSKLEETEQQASKPDVSGQPSTSGVKEGEINLRLQKGPKQVDTNVAGVKSCWWFNNTWENLLKGMEFRPGHFIIDVSGKFLGISKLSYWVLNAVYEFWHNNPHLKRGEELEIKFITVASEDMTNAIQYPSFHFMKLQRLDKKAFSYIKEQEMKLALVVNLTEDEISTRRAWRVWGCLTEMDKVKYPFKIYQNSVNGSFLLNTMTGITTRFANDNFEHKRAMIWKNRLIRTEDIRRKACNMMHVERWYEHICQ